ncbi:MAG: hypothetical protein F9K44_09645 [Hyphomicrobiaceae bacterium]|nr:MAG: hypothetical protein F9K44_09645 [Hyphomicrobiaceae bacterium]
MTTYSGKVERPPLGQRIARHGFIFLAAVSVIGTVAIVKNGGPIEVVRSVAMFADQAKANLALVVLCYFAISFVMQVALLPTGTIVPIVGGFLLGAPVASGVYFLSQLAATPVVWMMARRGLGATGDLKVEALVKRFVPERWRGLISRAREEGTLGAMGLRVLLPSAVACIVAAGLKISLGSLMLATLLVNWARPYVIASVGAAAKSFAELGEPKLLLEQANAVPYVLAGIVVGALLLLRHLSRQGGERPRP